MSLRARLAAGRDVGLQRIQIMDPRHSPESTANNYFELAEERVLVPEFLFDPSMGARPTLPELIVDCVERALSRGACGGEGVKRLLQQVVLVGGAADLPGIRPRTEYEVRALLRKRASPELREALGGNFDEVFVLNPPLGDEGPLTTPRFVPLVGGCVRAASSAHFDGRQDGAGSPLAGTPVRGLAPGHFSGNAATAPGIEAWMRRRLFNLDGPAIFRTGGGGGEDDIIWQLIGRDEESDQESDSPDPQRQEDGVAAEVGSGDEVSMSSSTSVEDPREMQVEPLIDEREESDVVVCAEASEPSRPNDAPMRGSLRSEARQQGRGGRQVAAAPVNETERQGWRRHRRQVERVDSGGRGLAWQNQGKGGKGSSRQGRKGKEKGGRGKGQIAKGKGKSHQERANPYSRQDLVWRPVNSDV